jgi:drug/metabolite transporter (DMT)-like permease
MLDKNILKSEFLLLLTAIIWGFAFVAQRAGMEFIGPFAFNGIRFALGSVSLVPLILYQKKRFPSATKPDKKNITLIGGVLGGIVIYIAASLQQLGIVYTTAGSAGFITSLYVIFVPILGLFRKHTVSRQTWAGVLLAIVGLYFLSVTDQLTLAPGDGLVFTGAVFWAIHVLVIAEFAPRTNVISLSAIQFAVCAFLSLMTAFYYETTTWDQIYDAAIPILYGGIGSVGIAYTLQVVGQRHAPPTHAAIILSLESLFAALGGWLILSEVMTSRKILGAALMLAGVILSQIKKQKKPATYVDIE